MAFDLMNLLAQQGINGDYSALYPAPTDPRLRPGITQPNGQEVQVPQGAPQQPQAPINPMMAAMGQQQAPQGAPQGSQGALGGAFDRMQHRQDASAINDGLINAGAAMLGGKDLQQGMAGALVGFNDAYDARKDKTKAENAPKVIPLADGAFTMLAFPDGTQKVVRNEEVGNYLRGVKQDATDAAVQRMMLQAKMNADASQAKDDRKSSDAATEVLQGTQSHIASYEKAKAMIKDHGVMDQAQAVPGVSWLANAFGTDGAKRNNFLQGLTVDETLLNTARTKGAISEKEMALFKSPIPDGTAGQAVWAEYIDRRLEALKKIEAFQQSQASKGSTPSGGYTGAASKAPTKSGAFKYLD